jgi:DNA-binding response OmpR family regulator
VSKILIIADDHQISAIYSEILKQASYEVHVLNSGIEAFYALPLLIPDIVLLDMQMFGVTGALLLPFIRRLERLKKTRVVIVSGNPQMKAFAKEVWGVDYCLIKPVSATELLEMLSTIPVEESSYSDKHHGSP